MYDAPVSVEGDDHDGEGGEVDDEAGHALDHLAEERAVTGERPVLGQHVARAEDQADAQD